MTMLNTCHIGDCRELLKQFAVGGVRAQMCVTSPPYFGLRDYGTSGQIGLEPTPDAYVAELVRAFAAVRDVLTDDGTLWLNLGDTYANDRKWGGSSGGKHAKALHGTTGIGRGRKYTGIKPKNLIGIPWRVAFALQADGWNLRSDIIWHKPNPMPESVADRPTKAHEYLFLLTKSESYYYNADAIAEPSGGFKGSSFTTARHVATKPDLGAGERMDRDTKNRRSVWTVPTKPFSGAHFATFPPELIEPCILAGSRHGDVVLDPFMGSGTTAQVAEQKGRQWIGCELQPDYAPLQARRLSGQRAMQLERF